MKTRKIKLAILSIIFISAIILSPAHASFSSAVYAWTDKASYLPGDSGTLYVSVLNNGTVDFSVKNVSIAFPWKAYLVNHWDGNLSDTAINQDLGQGQAFNAQYSFTVPTDGRVNILTGVVGVGIKVIVGINIAGGPLEKTAPISIAPATYPLGLATYVLPMVTVVILGVAVVLLTLIYMDLRKQAKK
jgi:hypothetical protein